MRGAEMAGGEPRDRRKLLPQGVERPRAPVFLGGVLELGAAGLAPRLQTGGASHLHHRFIPGVRAARPCRGSGLAPCRGSAKVRRC